MRTIRVDEATYTKLYEEAVSRGTSIGAVVRHLVTANSGVERVAEELAKNQELERENAQLRGKLQKLEAHIRLALACTGCGKSFDEAIPLDEELVKYLRSALTKGGWAHAQCRKDDGSSDYKRFVKELLSCTVCGKPLERIHVSSEWWRFIRNALAQGGWGHPNCIKKSKRV